MITIIKLLQSPVLHLSLTRKVLYFLVRLILWWVPKASPDYDKKEADVAYWLVEVDEDGHAQREIGFNALDKPILWAPTDQNMGLWTDSDRLFTLANYKIIATQEFEDLWQGLRHTTTSGY